MQKNGVFHRDLKPANVMLDSERNIVVIDFGISKQVPISKINSVMEPEGKEVTFTTAVGTMQWQSPEQIDNKGYSKRSEFFALAMNIMALITGKEPFESAKQWINCQIPKRDAYKVRTFPWMIHPLMERCLSENPEHRPSTIKEIFDEVSMARILFF